MEIEKVLSNLSEKKNFSLAIDFVLKKIKRGLRVYAVKDIQYLGRIVSLINKFNNIKHNDYSLMEDFNNQIIVAFKDIIEGDSADGFVNVLFFYPAEVLTGILNYFPKSNVLKSLSHFKEISKNMKLVAENSLEINNSENKTNKKLIVEIDKYDLDKKKQLADKLDKEITAVQFSRVEQIRDELLEKRKELEQRIEEITKKMGPFISTEYSREEIKEWLSELDDEGLFPMQGMDVEKAADFVEKHRLESISIKDTVVEDQAVILDEAKDKVFVDLDKVENRIQSVVEGSLPDDQPEITHIIDDSIEKEPEVIMNGLDIAKEEAVTEKAKDIESEILDSEHYDSKDVVSDLKDKHKKGTAI